MNETLTIASFSTNNASTKEKIIHLLAEKWPLSAKEVYEKVTREYSSDKSNQAIHKFLQELEKENTIEKTENKWKLKKEWIQKGQQFFNKAMEKQNGKINRYEIPENFEGTITFEFDSFTEFCTKTADLFANKILPKNNKEYVICVSQYGFWPIKFKFEQFELLYNMIRNFPKSKYIMQNDTSFGRWILEQYKKIGVNCAPIGTKVNLKEDVLIKDDFIMQIEFSDESIKLISDYWNKWKSINDTLIDFGLQPDPKTPIKVSITKNSTLANFIKKELERYF